MNQLTVTGTAPIMTSIELVEFINADRKEAAAYSHALDYVELAHRSFMAKVPEVLGPGCAKFLADYQHPQNKQVYNIYRLPKREACLMAMSYSYALQAKVFDRMTELEADAAPAFQVPTTLSGALRLAAEQAETIEAQALLIEAAKPAVEFVENYVSSTTGSKGFRETCKLLKANESRFREFLIEEKIMYRLGGALMPHAAHMDAGRFEVKAGTALETGHAYNSAKFTAKGINWIAAKWAVHNLPKE